MTATSSLRVSPWVMRIRRRSHAEVPVTSCEKAFVAAPVLLEVRPVVCRSLAAPRRHCRPQTSTPVRSAASSGRAQRSGPPGCTRPGGRTRGRWRPGSRQALKPPWRYRSRRPSGRVRPGRSAGATFRDASRGHFSAQGNSRQVRVGGWAKNCGTSGVTSRDEGPLGKGTLGRWAPPAATGSAVMLGDYADPRVGRDVVRGPRPRLAQTVSRMAMRCADGEGSPARCWGPPPVRRPAGVAHGSAGCGRRVRWRCGCRRDGR